MTIFSSIRRTFLSAALFTTTFAVLGLPLAPAHAADGDLLQKIKAAGEIRIGTEGTYPPYTYHDAKGTLTGFDVEIAEAVAKKLGVKLRFVETAWDSMIAGIDANRFDIIVNQVAATSERKEKYDFSEPYLYVTGAVIVKKGNKEIRSLRDLRAKRAAQTVTSDWADQARRAGAEIVSVQDFSQSVQLVASGRADATINSEVSTLDFLSQKPDAPIEIVERTRSGNGIAIPFRKGNPGFKAAIDKALEELRADGTLSRISLKYLRTDVTKD